MLERVVEVRFHSQWGGNSQAGVIGLGRLKGGGSSGLVWVVGEKKNPKQKARKFTSAASLSNIESGGPQAANNYFSG